MREAGLIEQLLKKWTPAQKVCTDLAPTSALSLQQTKTAFYVLALGLGLALIAVAGEVWRAQLDRHRH
ncbi:hypothetical protein ACOMHN_032955 [Nucella lapillus]